MAHLSSTQIKSDPEEFDFETPLESFDFIPPHLPLDESDIEDVSFTVEPPNEPAPPDLPPKPRKYTLFSENSFQVMVEHSDVHEKPSTDGRRMISQEIGYRIRELIHCSAQFMHHSNRTKLTTNDVSKAIQELGCDTIFGHNNSQLNWSSLKYRYIPPASVFIRNDPLVDLSVVASKIVSRRCKPTECTTTTEACERSTATTRSAFTIDWPQLKHFICDNSVCTTDSTQRTAAKLEKYFTQLSDTLANVNCTKFAKLSAAERDSLLSLIFFDLSTNTHIKPILHRFIKFALNALRTLHRYASPANIDPLVFSQTKLESYNVYLRTVRALMSNKHFIDWALHRDSICTFAQVLLSLSFDLRLCGDLSLLYHRSLHIRSQFAQLFGQILFKFCLPFSDLQNQLISLLYATIRDYQDNLSNLSWTDRAAIDYSILLLHRHMGFDVCLRFLLPLLTRQDAHFEEYFTEKVHHRTQSKVQATLQNVACTLVRGEICMVGELIMKGLSLLLVQVVDDSVCVDHSNQIYAYFSERFGETLAARLCPLPELATAKSSRSGWFKAWQSRLGHQAIKSSVDKDSTTTMQPVTPVSCRTRTDSTSKQELSETSPSKNRKRKGTGLLESMLSTDTSMMAKNESLSMFTESLLEASHRQYEKELPTRIFMFDSQYRRFVLSSGSSTSINPLIVFEGKRIRKSAMKEEPTEPDSHNVIKAKLRYPLDPSTWHTLWLETYKPSKRAHLPGFPGPCLFEWQRESEKPELEENLANIEAGSVISFDRVGAHKGPNDECKLSKKTTSTGSSKSSRTQTHIFHYHRRKQHLRSNFSLFTQL